MDPSRIARASSFEEASALVVDHLKVAVPLGYWAVTRFDGERQLYLEVRDDVYGLSAGDSHPWHDSFCIRMLAGDGPAVAPDAMAVPAYAASGVASQLPIGAYVGIPLRRGDGTLFGTICGLDPHRQAADLVAHEPLIQVLSALLGMILEADIARMEAARALERAELAADTDVLTGVLNRRGWDRVCAVEEARLRRFGDPTSVIVIDLDGLKAVNDEHGHAEGEHLVGRIQEAMAGAGIAASVGSAPYRIGAGLAAAVEEADAAMYRDKGRRRDGPT